ncbi:4,5-DOPA dioxygenase extradiol [Paracrocinitomix mangrovi]|uniref:4,5-DOPA-extradiol-dioxygenase n=1 Tax=Paracrocinitomix mangrovi TaxID=2862509 RepID=UPI001EDA3106|nr:4,5-DOPA dioxygenase extradiol [Paracrocinitomix mangrovi]UKN01092.1 4,5-DOPA dioxygenase extradiol [Paracrocinitomix mangrovi]
MKRSEFIQSLGLLAVTPVAMKLSGLKKLTDDLPTTKKMPVMFVGHGNPMNAVEDNSFTQGWAASVKDMPTPKAILCISAHWLTKGTKVTAMEMPKTIHDFYGFPQKLFDVEYNAPGAPKYATETKKIITSTTVDLDHEWGLDHGTWSVLVKMYPKADIPVFQLSLDYSKGEQFHYDLAKELSALRKKGVLIIGSGNIVHNLRMASFAENPTPYDWALEFDQKSKELIEKKDHASLIKYKDLGKSALLSIPTPDHYWPLLYTLALQDKEDKLSFFNEEMAFASGSMRSVIIQ